MADDADDNLFQLRVGKIKNAVIADTNAKAITVFQFLSGREQKGTAASSKGDR
jgi:hypothetical protein